MSFCPSIFRENEPARPDEICFRAACALGWAIDQNFPQFWDMTEDHLKPWSMEGWIDFLAARVLGDLHASAPYGEEMPGRLAEHLKFLSGDFAVRERAGGSEFLLEVASKITDPGACDPIAQVKALHDRGFELASRMVKDPKWSSQVAADGWGPNRKRSVRCLEENGTGTFIPQTLPTEILFRVQSRCEVRSALLEYLILEFEFMHEYVSHVLPVWKSAGGRLEEELLMEAANRYYRSLDRHAHRPGLVKVWEPRSGSHHVARRGDNRILNVITPSRFSHLVVELAVTPEEEWMKAEKDKFLIQLVQYDWAAQHEPMLRTVSVRELNEWLSTSKQRAK